MADKGKGWKVLLSLSMIAAGGVPYWDNGRGFVVIDLDLDLNKYGDADPNDFDYGRRSLTIEDVS